MAMASALGFHESIGGGLHRAVDRIEALGCRAVQMFLGNPRSWQRRPVSQEEAALFRRRREEAGLFIVAAHTAYIINLSSGDTGLFERSLSLFKTELAGAELIGADFLVTHLGSSRGSGGAVERLKAALREVKRAGLGKRTMILAENSAGGGHTYGSKLTETAAVIDYARSIGLEMGLCFDTCHGFAAGYPLSGPRGAATLVKRIEREAGLENLRLVHLNDSKGEFASGVDRHEDIGRGRIGHEALRAFIRRRELKNLPLILETPRKTVADDRRNLAVVLEMLDGRDS